MTTYVSSGGCGPIMPRSRLIFYCKKNEHPLDIEGQCLICPSIPEEVREAWSDGWLVAKKEFTK